jgi:hypothetical protein
VTRDADILDAEDAAALIGIGIRQLREGAARGDIPCVRVGRRFIFSRLRLTSWVHGTDAGCGSSGAGQEQGIGTVQNEG